MSAFKHPFPPRAALAGAVMALLGNTPTLAGQTSLVQGSTNFVMFDSTNTQVGSTDNTVSGNFDITARTITMSTLQPFFGLLWTAYNAVLYGPGTYSLSTADSPASCPSGTSLFNNDGLTQVTFTVPSGHVGTRMKFAWGTTCGIDVVNVWDSSGNSIDVDGDGILGMAMVDGPFVGFSANFNVTPSPAANTAPTANDISLVVAPGNTISWTPGVSDIADAINDTPTCRIVSQPSGGVGVASIAADCSSGSFDPQSLALGSTVTFTYEADDGHFFNNTSTGTVTVTVDPNWPTGSDGSLTAIGTTSANIDIASLVSDADGNVDYNTLSFPNSPSNGSISNSGSIVTYTANAGFAGSDTFTYSVNDSTGKGPATGTITVTVLTTAPASAQGTFSAGNLASSVGASTGGGLTASDVGSDSDVDQQCVGGCFDFVVSGLSAGTAAQVVLPLSANVPAEDFYRKKITYRKKIGGNWQDFDTSGGNAVATAPPLNTNPITCPAPGSSSYAAGLNAGDRCVQLTIVDGGPNDADGLANGTVVDPGGIGVGAPVTSSIADPSFGGGGCNLGTARAAERGDWWLLALALGGLGVWRRRRA